MREGDRLAACRLEDLLLLLLLLMWLAAAFEAQNLAFTSRRGRQKVVA